MTHTLVIVPCGKAKIWDGHPSIGPTAARDVYVGSPFKVNRAYAERSGSPWLILSAKYGFLAPDDVVPSTYEVTFKRKATHPITMEMLQRQVSERHLAADCATVIVLGGVEYRRAVETAFVGTGVQVVAPFAGLPLGKMLARTKASTERPPRATESGHSLSIQGDSEGGIPMGADRTQSDEASDGLAQEITSEFSRGELDFSARPKAPTASWDGMPEVATVKRLRDAGAPDHAVRLYLTFTAAMDRSRDADRLWFASERLFFSEPWAFDPEHVLARSPEDLFMSLRASGVSQRHHLDSAGWRRIAASLKVLGRVSPIPRAIYEGQGNVADLWSALQAVDSEGSRLFPYLRGPKVGQMWIRMLAYPGGATITQLEQVKVAVDVQVRKVTEYLGVTNTRGKDLAVVREEIQAAWQRDIDAHPTIGPSVLAGTAAALDPALWFFGKWGCTHCERTGKRIPISPACLQCRFDDLAGVAQGKG